MGQPLRRRASLFGLSLLSPPFFPKNPPPPPLSDSLFQSVSCRLPRRRLTYIQGTEASIIFHLFATPRSPPLSPPHCPHPYDLFPFLVVLLGPKFVQCYNAVSIFPADDKKLSFGAASVVLRFSPSFSVTPFASSRVIAILHGASSDSGERRPFFSQPPLPRGRPLPPMMMVLSRIVVRSPL